MPWSCGEYLFLCISIPTMLWLKVRYAARQMLQRRLLYAGVLVGFGVTAAILGSSAEYVAAAIAAAAFLNAITGWTIVLRNPSLDFTPASAGTLAPSTDQTWRQMS
jgi:hypothetical protein